MEINKITNRMKKLAGFSTGGKVIFIISLFVLIAVLLAGMNYLQGNVFDGVRAYVRGEGLWAKAQKDALIHLDRYSYSHSDSDYRAFQKAVKVNLGDKKARLALLTVPPDRQAARAGFLQGQNDAQDINAMIWFFLNFQDVSYMHEAIAIWTSADGKIAELLSVGEEVRRNINAAENSPEQMDALRERLQSLNSELAVLENRFSTVLGDGAQWLRKTTWRASIFISTLFIGIGIFVSHEIIKGIAQAEKQLRISESRFRSLKDSNNIGIVSWRMNGLIDEANDFFLDMLAYRRADIAAGNLDWRKLTPTEWQPIDQQAINELLTYGRCTPYEKVLLNKDGDAVPIYMGASLLNGDKEQGVAYIMDLRERKKAEEQMKLAATVFAASIDGILITDASRRIVSVNRALCDMLGYAEEELHGKIPKIFQSSHTTEEQYRDFWRSLYEKGHWQGDIVDRTKYGVLLALRLSVSSVKNNEGKISHYVAILSDITERKAAEDQLRHIAHHDPLTGLPNRVLFDDRIAQAIKHAVRNNTQFAVLFFDLDHFKPVNDLYGHKVGDKLLQIVANRLSTNIRGSDTVTRLGGDEFIMLLENVANREMLDRLLKTIVDSLCAPCRIDGHTINIGVSVGASIYPENGYDAKALIHQADIAMYGMKKGKEKS